MRCRLFSHRGAQASIHSGTSDPYGMAARHLVWQRSVQLRQLRKDIPIFFILFCMLHLGSCIVPIIMTSVFVYFLCLVD
jgi:hypothetical protein